MPKYVMLITGLCLGASATTLLGNVGYTRLRAAGEIVAGRHAGNAERPGGIALFAETVKVAATSPLARVDLRADAEAAVGRDDPEAVAELKREGIDLSAVQEIRELMRLALTEPDPARRLRFAAELKRRFGLDADPALYGRIERIEGGGARATFSERGQGLIREMTARTSAMYDALLRL